MGDLQFSNTDIRFVQPTGNIILFTIFRRQCPVINFRVDGHRQAGPQPEPGWDLPGGHIRIFNKAVLYQ